MTSTLPGGNIRGETNEQTALRKNGVKAAIQSARMLPSKTIALKCDDEDRYRQVSAWLQEMDAPKNMILVKTWELQ